MPDVFISYSRKDRTLVRRLRDALVLSGRDVWLDDESIPASRRSTLPSTSRIMFSSS